MHRDTQLSWPTFRRLLSARKFGTRLALTCLWEMVPKTPTIARIWRGRTLPDKADAYERYNYEVGIKPLIEKALGVQTFREDTPTHSEFITISYWESVEAMAAFTGGDPKSIHHLDRDKEFLIELPKAVQVLRIRFSHGLVGGDAS